MASFSASDVLVADARVLWAATGTALPDETTVDWNDSTGAYTNWTDFTMMGYTLVPTVINYTYETFEVDVQQSASPIKRSRNTERITAATTLAQFDGDLLALILGGTNTDTAAGASQKGFSEIKAGGNTALAEYLFAIEGYRLDTNNNEQPVRVFIHRGTIRQDGDIPFDKAGATGMPVIIEGLADSSKATGEQLVQIQIVTAPATS